MLDMKKKAGYTLIELLLAMGIMVLLIGISILSYYNYDRQNSLTLSAEQIKSFLNKNVYHAQSSTTDLGFGSIPTATVLEYNSSNNAFEIKKVDSNGAAYSSEKVYDSYEISSNISVAVHFNNSSGTSTRLMFSSPDGNITNNPSSIVLTSNNYIATVNINPNEVTITKNY